ncbi:glycoside hydrolase family 71 protein [Serpula lacrymans var. lacrymans S7.3]|uniref:Glycoside hydrolase family 71 protein n=1 Tax=Serpula lacrymans var. lacrymans (strain S7.3) TaxID=936435 RepID=F8Q3M4_SERL3|nr:glycoside hydrolase family 71 protein [Serpula lacrymans var. lacrymans S7.3]
MGHDVTVADEFAGVVVAHFIVGNTYDYTNETWMNDINIASSSNIDGFALNVGADPWQPSRLYVDGKQMVSTFSGENCTFGTTDFNQGWMNALKDGGLLDLSFIPAFFIPPATLPNVTVADGAFNWNAAWPEGDSDITFNSDSEYIANLGGRAYMASVSPWFFTHYGSNSYDKNFIYRGDDWLIAERWELLVQNMADISVVQIISWNDYGESHYVGPMEGSLAGSQAWTDGFDHQEWLTLMRLYPAMAEAPDPVGVPMNAAYTQDYLWAMAFLATPGNVVLTCGSTTETWQLSSGVSKLKLPLSSSCSVQASISKDGVTTLKLNPPGFDFSTNPPSYNFNAFVAGSSPLISTPPTSEKVINEQETRDDNAGAKARIPG